MVQDAGAVHLLSRRARGGMAGAGGHETEMR
jgi:hypothetical protein